MNQEKFEPQNELEKNLLTALEGEMDADEFMQQLQNAQVYMPIFSQTGTIKEFQRDSSVQPLIVENEEGIQTLILFTSPARAIGYIADHPGYSGGLLTEFNWVLRQIDGPFNIALNPGYEVGFDMEAEMVAGLMGDLPAEAP